MANLVGPSFTNGILRGEYHNPYQSVYTQSQTQSFHVGTKLELGDTKVYRYAYCGTASTRGLMQQGASKAAVPFLKYVQIAQTGYAQTAAANNTLRFLVTTGAMATGLANTLVGGHVIVATGTGKQDFYRIRASLHYSETLIDILLDEPLRTAIAATDKVGLHPNRWYGTIPIPLDTATAAPAGVPNIDITAGYFYWAQTKGPCAMTVDTGDTLVIGGRAAIAAAATSTVASTAGTGTATAYAFPSYGTVLAIGAADESALIDLDLD